MALSQLCGLQPRGSVASTHPRLALAGGKAPTIPVCTQLTGGVRRWLELLNPSIGGNSGPSAGLQHRSEPKQQWQQLKCGAKT